MTNLLPDRVRSGIYQGLDNLSALYIPEQMTPVIPSGIQPRIHKGDISAIIIPITAKRVEGRSDG
jgi:hypothetical protein